MCGHDRRGVLATEGLERKAITKQTNKAIKLHVREYSNTIEGVSRVDAHILSHIRDAMARSPENTTSPTSHLKIKAHENRGDSLEVTSFNELTELS